MRALRFLLAAVAAWLWLIAAASAQLSDNQQEFAENWARLAARAEDVIQSNRASTAALEQMRSDIAEYREVFQRERNKNADRIKTLQAEIAALGPAPDAAKGETEPKELTDLRQSMNDQLNALRVPRILAEKAYLRADGLITQIDRIIRDRKTATLLARGPSPLNPEYWPATWRDIKRAVDLVVNETAASLRSTAAREALRQRMPDILLLLVPGLLLMVRGRAWSDRLGNYLRRLGGRGSGVWSFVVSLAKIVLPLAGAFAIVSALSLTRFLGLRATLLLESLPQWAAILLSFRWLADQLVSDNFGARVAPGLQQSKRQAHILIELLAVMLILRDAIGLFDRVEVISDATQAVVSFPVILMTGLILVRLQRLPATAPDSDSGSTMQAKARTSFGKALRIAHRAGYVLAILAPILAAAGFVAGAEAIIYPVVLSIAFSALLAILHVFFVELWGWLTRRGDKVFDTLFSVLAAFVLMVLSIPVFAVIWGARVAGLTEVWTRFLAGFQIGGTTVSPTTLILFVAVFGIGYMATRLIQGGLKTSLLPKTRLDPGAQNAIVSGVGYVGVFLAGLVAVTTAGIDLSSLAIVAGALSVGIGFGLQTIVSNFVSGIILLVERPISKGDWIEVNGQMGYVRDISVRSTRIETFDRTDVIVPNSDLISGQVINYTRGNTLGRVIVPVGVAYGTDTRKVEKILGEIANAHPMVLSSPPPNVVFQGFGADSLDFEIRAILRDVNWVLSVKSDINHEIARRFAEAGIEIPFAQRDIWLRNPEALTGCHGGAASGAAPGAAPAGPDAAGHVAGGEATGPGEAVTT